MTRAPRRPTSELVIGSLFVFRLRKLEQGESYHIPGMAPTGSPALTTRMLLPSKCTFHRKMHCTSTCPECALPPVTFQLVITGMGDLAVDLAAPLSGSTLSEDSKEPRYNLWSCPPAAPDTARVEQSHGEE